MQDEGKREHGQGAGPTESASASTPGAPEAKAETAPHGQAGETGKEAAAGQVQQKSQISTSRGFGNWLRARNASLAFTSYQTGQLFLVGLLPNGKVSFHQSHYPRAMGVHANAARIYLVSNVCIWRLENVLGPGQLANQHFDAFYFPRNAQYTGDLDGHEIAIDADHRIIFVNTKFSCLAMPSVSHSFKPIWKPDFVSKLVPEDRCHLNGLAMENGRPRYVTAISRSDAVSGWRDRRWEGGVIIDVTTNEIFADDLSMPHSPRIHDGAIWVLDSGRGYLVRIDPKTRAKTDVAFCPGFLRGLAFAGRFAVVTTSLPRDGAFKDLELQKNLEKRDTDPKCAIYVIDLNSGGIAEWIEITGFITELFDVSVVHARRCPSSVQLGSPHIASFLTIEGQAPSATDNPVLASAAT